MNPIKRQLSSTYSIFMIFKVSKTNQNEIFPIGFFHQMKFILIAVLFVLAFSANDYDKEVHWDWKNINFDAKEIATKIKRHSRSFVWGTGKKNSI